MTHQELLQQLFDKEPDLIEFENTITGEATYKDQKFAIIGVVNGAFLDNSMSQHLAKFVLARINDNPKTNFLILVDTAGQQVTRHAEMIGLNRYFAHLIKTLHFARANGAKVFGLVYGKALGGAFIATALNAEKIYALESAQIAVMWLEAMSRVTKIPLEKLQALSKTSAIFSPGAENFVKLGAVEAILAPGQIMQQIMQDLNSKQPDISHWRKNGIERGGRSMANQVVNQILNA